MRKLMGGCLGWKQKSWTVNSYEKTFVNDENILKLIFDDVCTYIHLLKIKKNIYFKQLVLTWTDRMRTHSLPQGDYQVIQEGSASETQIFPFRPHVQYWRSHFNMRYEQTSKLYQLFRSMLFNFCVFVQFKFHYWFIVLFHCYLSKHLT